MSTGQPCEDVERLRGCRDPEERRRLLADQFAHHRARLRYMIELRLDERLRGRVDSSDVLQEAYLDASRRLDEFLDAADAPLFVWMRFLTAQRLQALHRHHLGVHARDARREISLYRGTMPQATSQALAARLIGKEISPSEAAMEAERNLALEEALNAMDPVDREVLALRHFEQLSSHEAAHVLALSEPAARKRYYRALSRLRETLSRIPGARPGEW